LKSWNKIVFGNVHEIFKEAKEKLQALQEDIDTNGHTDNLLNQEKLAHIDLENALEKKELIWKEKTKIDCIWKGTETQSSSTESKKIKNTTKTISTSKIGDEVIPEIIKADVISDVIQFFAFGWIMPNYNTNTLILIRKSPYADTIEQFDQFLRLTLNTKSFLKFLQKYWIRSCKYNFKRAERFYSWKMHKRLCLSCFIITQLNM